MRAARGAPPSFRCRLALTPGKGPNVGLQRGISRVLLTATMCPRADSRNAFSWHAAVRFDGTTVSGTDIGSSTATWLDGRKFEQNRARSYWLHADRSRPPLGQRTCGMARPAATAAPNSAVSREGE